MRVLLLTAGMLMIVGGYYMGLCAMTNQAAGQLSAIQQHYSSVGATADAWQQGDTSADFTR